MQTSCEELLSGIERNCTILIAEDDEDYAVLVKRALAEIGRTNPTHILRDGQEVIDYLQGTGTYADRRTYSFPAVMFLDLKMPRVNGFDVLQWLHARPQFHVVPTLVMSGSNMEKDVQKAYKFGAHSYLMKPSKFDDLKTLLNDTYRFWAWCIKPAVRKE